MRLSSFALALFCLTASPLVASAQTIIPGGNLGNQTWTMAGSPYVVQGDATVQAGATLTIQPGVTVQFATSDAAAAGSDPGRVELIVAGTLQVNGTSVSPVTMTSTSASSTAWYGVRALGGSTVTIDGLVLTRAYYGLRVEGGAPVVTTSTFSGDNYGTFVATGSVSVSTSIYTNDASGFYQQSTGSSSLTDCTLAYNTGNAVSVYGGSVAVTSSIVTNNASGYGLYASGGTISATYTDVWQNSSNFSGTSLATGCISTNPLFVSSSNFRLTSNSPARFGGMSGGDMGALDYVSDATPGLYGTLWIDTVAPTGVTTVPGDLTIATGVRLTLPPGSTLQFATSDIMVAGSDAGRGELVVAGNLLANGTDALPITLTSTIASATAWYGVRVVATATGSMLSHVILQRAYYGLRIEGGAITAADAMTFSGDNYGTFVATGGVTLTNAIYTNDASGFYQQSTGSSSLVHATLAYNSGNAVSVYGGSVAVTSSIVTNNASGYGLYASGGTIAATYTDVWQNSSNFSGTSLGTGCLGTNPLFVSSSNFRLTSNSPARFGGVGATDMGALPYVSDATPGLYGTLWVDTTLAAGTITVPGDLTVGPSAHLTIPAGTTLQFATSDLMIAGADAGRSELVVSGILMATGTTAMPVVFSSSSASATAWYGLRVVPGASFSAVGAVVERAYYGLRIEGGNVAAADAMTFRNDNYGTFVATGSVVVTNAIYTNDASAFYQQSTGSSRIVSSTLAYNSGNAVSVYGGSVAILDSVITNNASGYGVYASGGTASITYSDVWMNSSNFSGTSAGAGCISINPFYVSSSDFHLTATSPCLDSGTGTGAPPNDHDLGLRPLDGDGIGGAAFDMGAYEFARVTVCGDGSIGAGEVCDDGSALNGMYGHCRADCSGPGARCGDATTNGPETCDDGNTSNTDACLSSCMTATCGDGFVRMGSETCDDGNASNTDACTTTCMVARCGDGFVQAGVESCDDGNAANTDACVMCASASCGDGYVQAGVESCDDGNVSNVDACTNVCMSARCGDGYVGPGEVCDDGNMVDGDSCSNLCRPATCGDGIMQAGEACDDGNMVNGDACTNACQLPRCGDGIVQSTEQCDDGNMVDTDTCTSTCANARCGDGFVETSVEECDDANTSPTDACTSACHPARCGDGFVQAGVESCDDANARDDDNCLTTCVAASCGDGHLYVGVEACDDGNMTSGDGCSATCSLASCGNGVTDAGEECDDGNVSNTDGCTTTCFSARCGDGFQRSGVEACDDGNTIDTDGCLASCHNASCGDGFVHAGVETCDDGNGDETDACLGTCVDASCGDGHVEGGVEQCDDGNRTAGDGCNAACENEGMADAGVADAGVDASTGVDAGGMPEIDAGRSDASTLPDGGTVSPPSSGGCGCTAIGGGSGSLGALLALGLVLAVRRRRATARRR